MKGLIFFTLMQLTSSLAGQEILQQRMLSEAEAKADFDQYVQLLTETHPGLYRYTPEAVMTNRIDSLRQTLQDSTPFYAFFKKIAWLNASIHCSHSYVVPSADFDAYLMKQVKSIPFYVMPIQGKFYVLFNGTTDTSILPGFEILAINGKPMREIADEIGEHFWTDGKIVTARSTVWQGSLFRSFYYSLIDSAQILDFTFQDLEGNKVEKQFTGVSTLSAMYNYKKNPVNEEIYSLYKSKPSKYGLKILEDVPSTAVLTIPGFGGKKIHTEEDAATFMEDFMEKSMKKLEKEQIKNLVIELRYNRGGWDIMGTTLMSYLLKDDQSLPYYGPSYAITNDSEFLQYSDLGGYDEADIDRELEPLPDGTFKLREEVNPTFADIQKRPNAFTGNVYVLMDEYTSSAAVEFCAILKSNQLATLVGEETNGTYGGFNSTSFIKLTLPNSGIVVNTPLVRNHLAVDKKVQPLDRGVLPDHQVSFNLQDVLTRNDVQLQRVKELIKESQTQ